MIKKNEIPNELIHFDTYFVSESKSSKTKDSELGLFWINGECSEPFKDLTRLERIILSLHYKGYSDKEVGIRLGYHKNTIYMKRLKIKEKIKESLNK